MKVNQCQAPNCTNSFVPKKGAKKALYCSQKCNQRAYNARKRETRKAKALTVTIEEKLNYQAIIDLMPELDELLTAHQKEFGHEAATGAVKLIAKISEILKVRQ